MTLDDLAMSITPLLDLQHVVLKLPRSFDPSLLPGFTLEPLHDARGVLKMLVASRKRSP